jgi:hypothetical protein
MALLISCRPELISPNIAVDMMDNAKGVAHMPTATTTKEDSDSKSGQNHPHDFTKNSKREARPLPPGLSLLGACRMLDGHPTTLSGASSDF